MGPVYSESNKEYAVLGWASACAVSEAGYLLTNNHVVKDGQLIIVGGWQDASKLVHAVITRDVDLMERTLTVGRATTKTDAGERVIRLNANATATILELYHRAQAFGGAEPEHCVFPACENGRIDSTRPQTTWPTAWRHLTRVIHCPACGQLENPGDTCRNQECRADIRGVKSALAGLRFHDLRYHAITELAESMASDQTIMSIAGHVSPKMLAHYSHVRLEAKRKALDALSGGVSRGGTSQTTSQTQPSRPEDDAAQLPSVPVE